MNITTLETFVGFLFSYFPTLYYLGLKLLPQVFTRGGYPYNWEGNIPHTLIFLIIISLDSIKFLFVLHWSGRWWVR